MDKNKRISSIRMFCTTAVVLLHITQQYETLFPSVRFITDWLNLGLVMFFCISAFLYARRTISNPPVWFIKRYQSLLIPSVLWGCFLLILLITLTPSTTDIGSTILSCIGLEVWCQNPGLFQQLWFLTYILFCYLTVPLIQEIPCQTCRERTFWARLFMGTVIAQVLVFAAERILNIELLSVGVLLRFYLPYFVFRRYDPLGEPLLRIMKPASVLAFAIMIITCLCRYTDLIPLPASLRELIFIYTQTFSGFVLFFWLYRALATNPFPEKLLQISDIYSYEIYLTHCMFIGYSTSVIRAFDFHFIGVILALLLTGISSFILHAVSGSLLNFSKHFH